MAMLIQILAKQLKVWPKEAKCIAQDANSRAYPYSGSVLRRGAEWAGPLQVASYWVDLKELASDHETAIITEAMWKAEVTGTEIASTECKQFNATELRDRIFQIKITVDALQKEHDSAVNKLAAEGFQLVPVAPAEDMTDWRNWEGGDLVDCVNKSEVVAVLTIGKVYVLGGHCGSLYITDDDGDDMRSCIREGCFKFVSRP